MEWVVLLGIVGVSVTMLVARAWPRSAAETEEAIERRAEEVGLELRAQTQACIAQLKHKWLLLHRTLRYREGVPLADKIESFSALALEYVERHYPVLLTGPEPGSFFWTMILTAVLEAGTHAPDEVNAAALALQNRHARPGK